MQKGNDRKLKLIPLGGMGEIGKNITVLEYGNDIMVIDCGMGFPEDEMLGIDIVCLLYTSPSPRDGLLSRMPSSA